MPQGNLPIPAAARVQRQRGAGERSDRYVGKKSNVRQWLDVDPEKTAPELFANDRDAVGFGKILRRKPNDV
jgi:hypothetical protein